MAGVGSGSQGLRHVVTGQQAMRSSRIPAFAEADAAARLAAALVAGKGPGRAGPREPFTDPLSAGPAAHALLLPGQAVTRANLRHVVESGAVTARCPVSASAVGAARSGCPEVRATAARRVRRP